MQADVSKATQMGLAVASMTVAAPEESAAIAPSLVGFNESEAAMIGQSMKVLSEMGYDVNPLQQLVKADLPSTLCGMCLSTPPTGAALGDSAFLTQEEQEATHSY